MVEHCSDESTEKSTNNLIVCGEIRRWVTKFGKEIGR